MNVASDQAKKITSLGTEWNGRADRRYGQEGQTGNKDEVKDYKFRIRKLKLKLKDEQAECTM